MVPKSHFLVVILTLFFIPGVLNAQTPESQSDTQTNGQDFNIQFQFGYKAYHDGNLEEAKNRFQRIMNNRDLVSDTTLYRSHFWMGKTYYSLGYNDSAIRTWDRIDSPVKYRDWSKRERKLHKLRYSKNESRISHEWEYIGLISGKTFGRTRNVSPTALESSPDGGWYSASYKQGNVYWYSELGRILKTHTGFQKPTDILFDSQLGLLVSEQGNDQISYITDTGARKPLLSEGLLGPEKLLKIGPDLFVFDFGTNRVIQFNRDGDTMGTIWKSSPGAKISDVTVGPSRNFWILDTRNNTIKIISKNGYLKREINWNPNLNIESIWWKKNHLIAVDNQGISFLNPDTLKPTYLSTRGDTVPGSDVSDIILGNNRLVVSTFEASQILLYRSPGIQKTDMLIADRRFDFNDFPIIRTNLIINDSFRNQRFKYLNDKDLGIEVNNQSLLPSLLRQSAEVYDQGWILIVDNRIENRTRWEEAKQFLRGLIENSPNESAGSIWQVAGEAPIIQNFTDQTIQLKNVLEDIKLVNYQKKNQKSNTNQFKHRIHQAFNTAFGRRGPMGIIILSHRISTISDKLSRISKRSRNNNVPLLLIDPSINSLDSNHDLRTIARSKYQNFSNLNSKNLWRFYKSTVQNNYTAIFRSELAFQPSLVWRNFTYSFHYLGKTKDHHGGFMFP